MPPHPAVRGLADDRPPRALSIEHRLPLLISGLLLLVVVAFAWLAYREVRRSALDLANERLTTISRSLTQLVETGAQRASDLLDAAAHADSAPAAYLRLPDRGTEARATASLRRLLGSGRPNGTAVTELWSADRRRLLSTGPSPALGETEAENAFLDAVADTDSLVYGPLRAIGPVVFTSTIAPIVVDGERRGYLVRWSRVASSPQSAQAISRLIGSDAEVYLADPGSGVVMSVAGDRVQFPLRITRTDTTLEYGWPGRGEFVAATAPIRSMNWVLVTAFPRGTIFARSTVLLRRLAALALVLVLVGGAAAWLLSRGITTPLSRLTRAAEQMATGDY